jgi:hypothetical protein
LPLAPTLGPIFRDAALPSNERAASERRFCQLAD